MFSCTILLGVECGGGGDTLALDMWLVTGEHYCMTMVSPGPAQPTTTAGMYLVWGADLHKHKGGFRL